MANVVTKTSDLFIPEVVGPEIMNKLVDDIKFSQFAKINYTLQGKAGDTVTRWFYSYIGDAEEFAEGEAISYGKLSQSTKDVKIKKAGRGVKLTDEAALNAVGDPEAEAVAQVRMAIAQKIDNDCKAVLEGVAPEMTVGDGSQTLGAKLVGKALALYGEDLDGSISILISPFQAQDVRNDPNFVPASEIKAEMMVSGALGQILGANIVQSNKIKAVEGVYTNFLIKGTPITIEIKRDIMPERARDIDTKITKMNADVHYTTYLENEANVVAIKSKENTEE
jgi:hypothetical protein